MNRILILILSITFLQVRSQTEVYTSNWITGMMEYNPAVAGKSLDLSAAAIFRNQWTGFDGAPAIQLLQAHKPMLSRRLSYGLGVRSVFARPVTSVGLDANFAYRLRFPSFQVHMGTKLSGTFENNSLTDTQLQELDPAWQNYQGKKLIPNVGFGVYVFNDNYYIGLSTPRMIRHRNVLGMESLSWYYLSAGYAETVSNAFRYRFAFFSGWDTQSPLLLDFNASALFGGKLWVGTHYGTQQYGLYFQYVISPQYYVGYSVDVMNRYNYAMLGTSHEITFRYEVSKNRRRVYTYHL
ncbi:MAG: PorP/SprF family type IX secretion system membrane protein [Flavobacteriales bacterium]|nr:PorP/SprF family type IX secretion system membrane protein [Flavobacteriales bacterium]